MSTGAVLFGSFTLAFTACAGGGSGMTTGGDRVLVADPTMINIIPHGIGFARFVLTSGGVPIAGQQVNVAIMDDPDPKGAVLVAASAVTDVSGVASVDVHAGDATTLRIRATAGSVTAGSVPAATLTVVVALGTGSVLVTPYFAANSRGAQSSTSIEVRIRQDQPCAAINLAEPPDPVHDMTSPGLPTSGGTARFDLVTTADAHAVIARALSSHGNAVAVGCVDVAGASLVTDRAVEVWLPLHDFVPNPIGTFAVQSTLAFQPPLAAAAAIAAPWRDLGDCPLDPAQLFLDCTVDALSAETPDDPRDCVPNPAPGGEGTLGDLFAARRGVPILDGTGAATACRSTTDISGAPSLDAIAMRLFGTPTPALLVDLPAIGNQAAHILDQVVLTSTLTVATAGSPGDYLVTHSLVGAQFGSSATVAVDLASLALPVLTAYTTANTDDGTLAIDNHGFSLRLGRAARSGFGQSTLAPRVGSPKVGDMVVTLAALARSDDGAVSGCAALDRALCAAVGADAGCLATACPAGLGTLAAKLDAAFDAADGTGLDFYLSGSTPLIDKYNDGTAKQLGAIISPMEIASWSVDLRTAAGRARLSATFEGTRN